MTVTAAVGPVLADLVDSFNINVEKLNGRMFTFLDYAIVGSSISSSHATFLTLPTKWPTVAAPRQSPWSAQSVPRDP